MGLEDEGNEGSPASAEDDDLTNLTWLQDGNLLRNMTASGASSDDVVRMLREVNENVSPCNEGPAKEGLAGLNRSLPCSVPPVAYNPQIHVHAKPPYSFSSLIFMAIESSPNKALPVKEIYSWIVEHFPYYQTAPSGWKNTVRHNLSLNKCFRKVDKAKDELLPLVGKGSLWLIDPELRPNLLQAVRRTPAHIYPYMSTAKSSIMDNCVQLVNNSNKTQSPKKGLTFEKVQSSPVNIPQPNLFPLLSKRLLIPIGKASSRESKEADAAESMLTLTQYNNSSNANVVVLQNKGETVLPDSYIDDLNAPIMTVTVNPSNDHNYYTKSHSPSVSVSRVLSNHVNRKDSDSDDEEQSGASFESTAQKEETGSSEKDVEEGDDVAPESDDEGVKGAEALLNLALRSKRSLSSEEFCKRAKLSHN